MLRPTIFKEGDDYSIEQPEDGIWPCPFCKPDQQFFTSTDLLRDHIHNEHAKSQVRHNGMYH